MFPKAEDIKWDFATGPDKSVVWRKDMVIRAVKKAGAVTLLPYDKIQEGREQYHIELNQEGWVWNGEQKCYVQVNQGDFLRVDNPNDIYPISKAYFDENYTQVE